MTSLDLQALPATYVLHSLLRPAEHEEWTARLTKYKCALTNNPRHARLLLTATSKEKRALRETEDFGVEAVAEVVKLAWIQDSIHAGQVLDMEPYRLCQTRPLSLKRKRNSVEDKRHAIMEHLAQEARTSQSAIERAIMASKPKVIRQDTAGEEDALADHEEQIVPERVYSFYACQRETPLTCPNEAFVDQLQEIKLARLLAGDEIGVRAYATSIAAIRAFPYEFTNAKQVQKLPGCDLKMVGLLSDFLADGTLDEVRRLQDSPEHRTLKDFYNAHGVGAVTARHFYHDRGFRTRQEIIDADWDRLPREQQIGFAYYEDFLKRIPRDEVAQIADTILEYAQRARSGTQGVVVGGYRRGKPHSGDVDIILSNPRGTVDLCYDVVKRLEEAELIVHTIKMDTSTSKRHEHPLPSAGDYPGMPEHGFDNLDKALTVWKSPNEPLHRRVDIIVAPWRFFGTAIVGWSGATTFERDLRRYAKHRFGWTFDSSGIRDRRNGEVVECEGKSAEEMERRVFHRLELEYVDPTLRNTG